MKQPVTHEQVKERPEKQPSDKPKGPDLIEKSPAPEIENADPEHEGATEDEIGDRRGPGAGYDQEPEQERSQGGVS